MLLNLVMCGCKNNLKICLCLVFLLCLKRSNQYSASIGANQLKEHLCHQKDYMVSWLQTAPSKGLQVPSSHQHAEAWQRLRAIPLHQRWLVWSLTNILLLLPSKHCFNRLLFAIPLSGPNLASPNQMHRSLQGAPNHLLASHSPSSLCKNGQYIKPVISFSPLHNP